ncbi:MAG: NUDIX domain-containing protein [Butyribacter sp.]|nr:NUDIX domain-containing protein [Butyribacter sp.]
MARAKYQVLVIPYYIENQQVHYCLFHRSDMNIWQFIAGGGEDEDDSILTSAKREAMEEASIPFCNDYMKLDTVCSIPANCFKNAKDLWGKDCYVIPEYCFGVRLDKKEISISSEHTEYEWCDYQTAASKLKYDSNKTALWELDCRLKANLAEGQTSVC